jgi:membrane-associated HD superfamily phosphohydrolase
MQIASWIPRLEQLLLTIWVGSLLAIGYLAVPVLFHALDDRQLAGQLAGQMFHIVNLIGLLSGVALLLLAYVQGQQKTFRQKRTYLIVAMLLLTLITMLVLQPQMEAIKAQVDWHDVSELKSRFGLLHGVSSVLYLLTSIIGVMLVITNGRR